MAKQEFSTRKLAGLIPTEADAYLLLENLRWGGGVRFIAHAGSVGPNLVCVPGRCR